MSSESATVLTFYGQQMLMLHRKYALSANAKKLLEAHDDWKHGRIDQDELGRLVRLSGNMRKAVTDTIAKCASVMRKKPAELKNCVDIIQACTEILSAADKPPSMDGFPLLKLPAEIRRNVYHQYTSKFLGGYRNAGAGFVPFPKKSSCACAGYAPPAFLQPRLINMALAATCQRVRNELLEYFYRKYQFHFSCGCELLQHLKTNVFLRKMLTSVKVHWTGPKSDKGFDLLAKCPKLKEFEIIISKSTTGNLTKRETQMREFFTSQKPPRLIDALGMDELILIRGVDTITVTHLQARQGARRSDEERANLGALLRDKLTRAREDGSLDEEGDD
ncbi:hypothetical protein B0H63DRAFT_564856 [Podospora didyma]|uniref:Uncharacterized protein n=1 Tax=Podospora didyma TaxID=330526 RepID=A0AAE0N259_9PEZI|nr:hypothetical protein B0H63DRAFT_564856 [Podospora didyma]